MWRLLCFIAAPLWGEEVFVEEGDAGYLEQRLDDGKIWGEAAVRWRVRGAGRDWERLQVYQRLEWRPREGQAFFGLAERDPGEREWRDFSAFYYHVQARKGEVVVGDLRPGFAAGVVFGRGRRGGVDASVPADDSARLGYRSSGENAALRGVAWRCRQGAWEGALLGGRAWRDGRLDDEGRVRSLPAGGYHVTATEVGGKDLLAIDAVGGRIRRQGARWQWGMVVLGLDFSREVDLRRRGRTPWGFVGARQKMVGGDVRGGWGRVRVAAEAARDGAGRWGAVGAVWAKGSRRRARLLARYYAPGFHSFFGAAPGASGMQNELGGVAEIGGRGWRAYAEIYRRPQRSYFVPVAATYATWGGERAWRMGGAKWRGQWQGKLRPRWRDGQLQRERGQRGRLGVRWGGWRGRGELQRLRGEWGALVGARYQRRWLALHLSRFRTGSYATRVYEYEADLPGAVSVRPLHGSGWRGYALVTCRWGGWAVSGRYRLQWDRRVRRYGGVQLDWTGGEVDKR